MVDFVKSIKEPFLNWKALFLGIVVGAIPIVDILLIGFGLGTARKVFRGKRKPMSWWNMPQILYDSIAGFSITACYFLPFFFILVFLAGPAFVRIAVEVAKSGLIESALVGTSPFELASMISLLSEKLAGIVAENSAVLTIVGAVGVILYYLLPFALVNYARKHHAVAAFDASEIRRAFNPKYFFYWVLFHFYILTLFTVLSLFFFLPILNLLLAGFILFVYFSSGFNLTAHLLVEAH